MKTSVRSSIAAVILLVSSAAPAVALRQEKATDASVCDLGPNTNPVLARRMLIPADAQSKDQIEAYFRLAATFVVNSCSPGQLLVVHGDAGQHVDVASLTQLANSACVVSSIQRTEVPFTYAGRTRPGFELRCPIMKKDELAQKLVDAERTDPTDSLRARMAGTQQVEQGSSGAATKKDCAKVTLATLVQGGSRDCK